jgi:hypothetical protein
MFWMPFALFGFGAFEKNAIADFAIDFSSTLLSILHWDMLS